MKLSAVVPVALLIALLAPASALAKEVVISIAARKFQPAVVEVSVGDTVVWENEDDRDHTVTADDEGFDSGKLRNGKRFSHRFNEAGEFTYHCEYHPRMKGKVVVRQK